MRVVLSEGRFDWTPQGPISLSHSGSIVPHEFRRVNRRRIERRGTSHRTTRSDATVNQAAPKRENRNNNSTRIINAYRIWAEPIFAADVRNEGAQIEISRRVNLPDISRICSRTARRHTVLIMQDASRHSLRCGRRIHAT